MSTISARPATASSGKTVLALVAIFALLLSLLAVVQPVAADHSGFEHQPLPIDTSTFEESDEECKDADLEPGQVLLHWIANQQNVVEPITLTLFLQGGGELSADSYKWNEPGNIDGNVTHHFQFILDGDLVVEDLDISTGEGNVRLSHVCRGDEEEGEDLVVIKQDLDANTLDGVGFTLGDGEEVLTVDGQITFEDLVEGSYTLTETSNPDADCETGGTLTVMVSAEGTISVTDDDETDGLAVVSWDDTNTLVLSNDCQGEEEVGTVEIDKLFCFTDDEASTEFFVFGPLFPGELRTHGEDELPEEGCWTEAVAFTIAGGDLEEPMHVMTGDDGILEFNLPASENGYVITEDISGESAEFLVADGEFTAIVVLNLVAEEETGLVKVIKLFCEGDEAGVEFIVEGGDAAVPLISGCEVGNATFLLDDLEITTANGIAVTAVDVGEYTFEETDPNAAEYEGTIVVEEGEITTIIVINTFDEGEEPGGGGPGGGNETPREGTQGGNPLPNTASSPIPTSSAPAALLALLMLAGLGAASYAVRAEARRRR